MRGISILWRAAVAALLCAGAAEARGFQPIYHFAGGADGTASIDKLLRDSAGNLYGVTTGSSTTLGTVFMLSPGGTETVLYTFQNAIGQSSSPTGGVIMDAAGNLYGEAINGGSESCSANNSVNPDCGSVYRLAPDGTLTTLYSFQGSPDGGVPRGGLLLDAAGNLYGTTEYGGTSGFCTGNCGTVFKIAPGGGETVLYNFQGQSDGARPASNLIADKHHNLYGTTIGGGLGDNGTVFKLAPNGVETQLYAFGGTDGANPYDGVVMDKAGNLYGTTQYGGGGPTGAGVVYKLTPGGTETVLHAFFRGGTDGFYPLGGILLDKKGDLYGTTYEGGRGCHNFGCGTAYKIAQDGTYSRLYLFQGGVAHTPSGGLVDDSKGNLYGSAIGPWGAPGNLGILFTMRKTSR